MEQRFIKRQNFYKDKSYMEKRLINKVDGLIYKRNLYGKENYTKTYTKMEYTQRKNLYFMKKKDNIRNEYN